MIEIGSKEYLRTFPLFLESTFYLDAEFTWSIWERERWKGEKKRGQHQNVQDGEKMEMALRRRTLIEDEHLNLISDYQKAKD